MHWGATSQDVTDTALVLLLKRAEQVIRRDLVELEKALRRISISHARTVALGRTLLQPAPPVTLGLQGSRLAWRGAASAIEGWRSFRRCFGHSIWRRGGTLAALGRDGVKVGRALARELV